MKYKCCMIICFLLGLGLGYGAFRFYTYNKNFNKDVVILNQDVKYLTNSYGDLAYYSGQKDLSNMENTSDNRVYNKQYNESYVKYMKVYRQAKHILHRYPIGLATYKNNFNKYIQPQYESVREDNDRVFLY